MTLLFIPLLLSMNFHGNYYNHKWYTLCIIASLYLVNEVRKKADWSLAIFFGYCLVHFFAWKLPKSLGKPRFIDYTNVKNDI